MNNTDKNRFVKSLVIEWKADIMSFKKIKLGGGRLSEEVKQIWGGRRVRFACPKASETRGGILLLWDCREWKCEILETVVCT